MKKTTIFNVLIFLVFISGIFSVYFLNNNKNIILESELSILNQKNKFLEKQQRDISFKIDEYIKTSDEKYNQLLKTLETQDKDFLSKMNQIKKEQQQLTTLSLKTDNLFAENLKVMGDKITNSEEQKKKIIKKWSKVVARVECENDSESLGKGSGVYFTGQWAKKISGKDNIILTNNHVIKELDSYPDYCKINFLNDKNSKELKKDGNNEFFANIDEKLDVSYLDFPKLENLGDENYNICTNKLEKGDEILILGYPAIGSNEDITITFGIISGYDKEFYMTDTKIAKGNSGGAAISIKDDCYFGIPTLVMKGQLEVLGRVLDINNILDK